jgi:signal peptidase I
MAMQETEGAKKAHEEWGETAKIIVHALILAVLIRIFLFQPFNIPSGSMKATLLVGDYLFVSKYSYGYSHFSLPFSPNLFSGRVWSADPKRGDVAVFKNPHTGEDWIKRVIGLPGDAIQVTNGVVYINGQAVPKEAAGVYHGEDRFGVERDIARYQETLPNGVKYYVLDEEPRGQLDNTGVYHVPAGKYFMMGDNRDNSTDSRVSYVLGPVPLENFVGRADLIFFSIDEHSVWYKFWRWPFEIRWSRFFNSIR